MKTNNTSRIYQSGFGLVEIMVAIALGLLLIAGVTQIYLSSKKTYQTSEAVTRLQENGRFAIVKLGEDIRMAGYFGCGAGGIGDGTGLNITNNLRPDAEGNQQTAFGDFDVGITGVDNFDGGTSDSVTIMRTSNTGIKVTQQMPQTAAIIFVTPNDNLVAGDILLVCDVAQGDIFQMTGPASTDEGKSNKDTVVHNSGSGDPGNYSPGACDVAGDGSKHCLSKSYGLNAKVLELVRVQYWVADGAAGTPALFRSVNGGTALELVEGVENLQIVYGVDTTGDRAVDSYVDAGSVANWDQVMSARVSLLLSSIEDNITRSADAYTFDANGDGVIGTDEQGITAGDKRLRQVFTGTINIRNRTL